MTVKERYEGFQTLALELHKDGCHFLTLCSIADEYRYDHSLPYIDLIESFRLLQSKGLIARDCFIKDDGTNVLSLLTDGAKWTRKDVVKLGHIRDNDYTEAVYFNPRTQYHHFRRRYFDTLEHSVTVEEGYVESYRIYTVHD